MDKTLKKYKIAIIILAILIIGEIIFLTSDMGGDLFKGEIHAGEIATECSNMPETNLEELRTLETELETLLASEPLVLQKEYFESHEVANSLLGEQSIVSDEECDDGAAFISDVFDLPDSQGICIPKVENVSQFMNFIKDEKKRSSIKESIAIFTEKFHAVQNLSQEEKEKIAEAKTKFEALQSLRADNIDKNYCEFAEDSDFESFLSQSQEYGFFI